MFGKECCLPTGEIMKIIGINTCMLTAEIQPADCEAQIVNLPLCFPGKKGGRDVILLMI